MKPAAVPEIEGGLRYRDELTIEEPDWGPGAVKLTYQWLRDGKSIGGATESSYRLTASDIGGVVSLRITGSKDGHQSAVQETKKVGPILPGKLKTTAVEVSGRARVGSVLTASADPWGPGEVKLSWQWYRGTTKIDDATKHTYQLTAADLGKVVKVRLTGSAKHFDKATKDSEPTGKVAHGVLSPTPTPLYHGEAEVGQEVTALPKEWGPGNVKLSYQWYREVDGKGQKIKGATEVTYLFVAEDLGKRLRVRVTGSKAGYTAVAKYSGWTTPVTSGLLTPEEPTLSGVPVVGKTLTVDPGQWQPEGVVFSYRWYRDHLLITRESASTYVVNGADVGHRITVRVTGSLPGYTTIDIDSSPTAVVAGRPR